MAKHCNVCNQDYADDLAACPRCTAAKKTQLAGRGEERTTQLRTRDDDRATRLDPEATPTDSAVNLGGVPEQPAEGDSGVNLSSDKGAKAAGEDSSSDLGAPLVAGEDSSSDLGAPMVADEDSSSDLGEPGAESGSGVAKPGERSPTASDIALESLMSETRRGERPVSEIEGDDQLDNLEESPAASESGVIEPETAEIADDEEAISAAEAEEPIEAADAEEEKPAKAAKPRSNIPVLAGTALLGILLGAGGTIGTQALMGPGEKEKQPRALSVPQGVPQNAPQNAPQANPSPTFEALAARVAGGDWDEAKAIEQVQGANAKELAARGAYRLGTYLKTVGSKINSKDPALASAIEDLKKAADQKEPDALYDLAFIKELAGEFPEARAEYAKAAQDFANDPLQKQRFEAALLRVELKEAAAKIAGAAMLPQRPRLEDRALLLALFAIALQQAPAQQPQQPQQPPQPGQPAQQSAAAENKEAGFDFWNASRLAREGKFDDAIRALDQARKLHDRLRFTRLRKAQNPLSDPAEDIFLRCCDELKAYWQLEKELRAGGYLTDKNTPAQALQALVQKTKQGGGTAPKELTDKLAAAQKAQKDAEANATNLEKQIQKSKADNTKLDDDLKAAKKAVEERQADLTSAKKELDKLKSDSGTDNTALKKIREELIAAKLLAADSKADVGEAVRNAITVAKSNDPQGALRRQRDEISQLSASLQERRQPVEMLPLWLLLLDENRNQTALAGQAMIDAQRVLADPRKTASQKGKAEVVLGLALRNTEQFGKAKTMLEAARRVVDNKEWLAHVDAALKEVSNPAGYFASQAQLWYDHGRMETALDVLAQSMKVLPAKEQGKLLARRSLIELDAARSKVKGPLPPTEPLLIAAQKDAEAAVKTGAAEGHYAAGRIAEELGRVDAAIASYRAALAAYGGKLDADGSRYRMALARVLLLPREARPILPSPVAPPKAAEKVGWRNPAPYPAQLFEDRKRLVLMLTLGLQAPLLPGDEPGLEEAEKLADEVLQAPPGTVPFTVLAQALAIKGRWSLALQVYVEGIRPMLPREYFDGLVYLIQNDPRLRRPDSLRVPNPLDAEKHFAAGLNFYFDRDYRNAEKEFLLTIENDSQDARFFYFLGLSRLALNRRRDAYADFSQGTLLERVNRPASPAVDESLERIQGPMRFILNDFRQSPER